MIPPDRGGRSEPRPGWTGGRYAWMRAVLASEHGKQLYHKRIQMIEFVFAHTKHNRLINRFHRRGRIAVRTEWRLLMATHNLTKLHRHQLATLGGQPGPDGSHRQTPSRHSARHLRRGVARQPRDIGIVGAGAPARSPCRGGDRGLRHERRHHVGDTGMWGASRTGAKPHRRPCAYPAAGSGGAGADGSSVPCAAMFSCTSRMTYGLSSPSKLTKNSSAVANSP